jgi:NOL1/NOP2/fmu family ribosome biogenesis protein
MSSTESKERRNKRENYAKILSKEDAHSIWAFLEEKFGINTGIYEEKFSFAQNRRGRVWLASNETLEFVAKERLDPAKVLTCAIGKSDSKKLLQDVKMHVRLTIDGAMYFNKEITKNILYISEIEEEIWYSGEAIDKTESEIQNDVYILAKANTKQIIGSTIAKNGFLLNFVPKWRRPERISSTDTEQNEIGA